jgi:hypothetical protein
MTLLEAAVDREAKLIRFGINRIKGLLRWILLATAMCLPSLSVAISHDQAIQFLKDTQSLSGNWESGLVRDVHATAEILVASHSSGLDQSQLVAASNYLSGVSASGDTDFLARSIAALAQTGNDVSEKISALISISNSTGGWSAEGYAANALDTALALRALAPADISDSTALAAVSFLVGLQSENGGWGCSQFSEPEVVCTTLVLEALSHYNRRYVLTSVIDRKINDTDPNAIKLSANILITKHFYKKNNGCHS